MHHAMATSGILLHRKLPALGPQWNTRVEASSTGWLEIQQLPVVAMASGQRELQHAVLSSLGLDSYSDYKLFIKPIGRIRHTYV